MEDPITGAVAPFRIPILVDLALHGLPGPFLLIDFLFCEAKYSQKMMDQTAPVLAVLCGVVYGIWVEYCGSSNGICKFSQRL